MEKHEILKEEYVNILNEKIKEKMGKAELLKNQDSMDEANFEKIKANVLDIFLKMFNISYDNIYKKLNNKNVISAINSETDKYANLYHAYMNFFSKIPAPWIEKSIKDKEHNMVKEYLIEEMKLNTVKEIKDVFDGCYNRFK